MLDDQEKENKKGKRRDLIEDIFVAPQFLQQYGIYDDYDELIDGVFYYQDQQIEIRMTSIKILIGTIALSGGLSFYNIGLSAYLLTLTSSLLPLLSLFLITISLFHDLVYKEGLKLGFFSEASKYEKKYPWIVPYHQCLITDTKVHKIRGTTQISFYFGSAGILLLISALALCVQFNDIISRLIIFVAAALFLIIYVWFINKFLKHPKESLKALEEESEKSINESK